MRRQSNHSPVCRCYCANNDQNDSYYNNSRKINVVETCTVEDDCCCRCGTKKQQTRQSSFQGENVQIDEETLRALCALRQKACRFINSETEYTTTSDSAPRSNKTCQCQNQGRDEKYLIRIEDLLEYSPQSQFLKKLKRHFQGSPDDQSVQNIFKEREFISNSVECNEDAREITNSPTKRSAKSRDQQKECKCCTCNQKEKIIEKAPEPVAVQRLRSQKEKYLLAKKVRGLKKKKKAFAKMNILRKIFNIKKLQKNRSISPDPENLSNIEVEGKKERSEDTSSQKHSSQKQSSQETFEPSLKRPQEDSCERCWRYASPSRSPVNKPDQRYNPNFRRAHSWQDFSSVKDSTSEYFNSENLDKNTGPVKRQEELTKDFNFPSAQKPHPLSNYTSARMKELDNQSPAQRASERNYQRESPNIRKERDYQSALSAEEVKKHQLPRQQQHLLSNKERKPRPKSYTPGVSPRNQENFPTFLENLNCPEYVDMQTSSKTSPKVMSSSRSMRSNISTNSKMPLEQPEREKFFRKTKTKSTPIKKPSENTEKAEWTQNFNVPCDPAVKESISFKVKKAGQPKEHTDADRMPNASMPFDYTENENVFSKIKAKNFRSAENKDAEWVRRQEFVSVDFNKPSYCIPNSQSNVYADTSRTPLSKSGTNRSSSRYLESDPSPKIYSQRSASPPKNIYNNQMPITPQYCPEEVSYPPKSRSTHAFQNKNLPPQQRLQTMDHIDPRCIAGNLPNQEMRSDVENQFRRPPHQFRPCFCGPDKCQPISKGRQRDFSSDREEKKKEYCCHCRRNSSNPRNSYIQNGPYQDRAYNEMPRPNEINDFEERYPNSYAVNACRCSTWQGPVNYTTSEGKQGKTIICPYKEIKPEKYVSEDCLYPENQKYYERPNQNYPVYSEAEHRNSSSRRGQFFSNYVPTNYCVFYMKKNQDNKEDEVEVLVEELTEKPTIRTKKECKTTAIEEKMRKILESREDSMALRFQKGVSEVTRVPESSRTLYF